MKWFKRIYLLYFFGFLLNFRPIDPFLYKYFLVHNNLTSYEVGYKILPTLTYSSTVNFVLMFFLSGLCCFKVLLAISSVSAILSTCIRAWSYSYEEVVLSEVSECFFLN